MTHLTPRLQSIARFIGSKNGVTTSDISKALGIALPTISVYLSALMGDGILATKVNPADKRRRLWMLSTKGKGVLKLKHTTKNGSGEHAGANGNGNGSGNGAHSSEPLADAVGPADIVVVVPSVVDGAGQPYVLTLNAARKMRKALSQVAELA